MRMKHALFSTRGDRRNPRWVGQTKYAVAKRKQRPDQILQTTLWGAVKEGTPPEEYLGSLVGANTIATASGIMSW